MFMVVYHISGRDLPPDKVERIRSLMKTQGTGLTDVFALLPDSCHKVGFHELYHFWQGLRLPFLYRYALIALHVVSQAFTKLSEEDENFHNWNCSIPDFDRLNLKDRIGFTKNGESYWGGDQAEVPITLDQEELFSPIDLLECAASLADFQIAVGAEAASNPDALERWEKRRAAYLVPLKFAGRYLENQKLALRALLPLINASFCTTEPVRAFKDLLYYLRHDPNAALDTRRLLAQGEPGPWKSIFEAFLNELKFEAPPNSCTNIRGAKYYRLTLNDMVYGLAITKGSDHFKHPILAHLAEKWIEMERKENPEYGWLLDYPGYVNPLTMLGARSHFGPPFGILRIHTDTIPDPVGMFGDPTFTGYSSLDAALEDATGMARMVDIVTMYSAIRRASGAHFDRDHRTCSHKTCPEYEHNYCNSYPIVPSEFSECGFSSRMNNHISSWRNRHGRYST